MSATAVALHEHVAQLDAIQRTFEVIEQEGANGALCAALDAELRDTLFATRSKIDSTAHVLEAMEAAEDAAQREIDRLTARKARIAKERERLEGYVISVLTGAGVAKFEGHISTLAVRKNPVSVVIFGDVSADYMRVPVIKLPAPAPDKGLIRAALENGIDVPGARLSQSIRLVRL